MTDEELDAWEAEAQQYRALGGQVVRLCALVRGERQLRADADRIINSFVAVCAMNPELLDVHESVRYYRAAVVSLPRPAADGTEIAGREVAGETPAGAMASRPASDAPPVCRTCGHAKRDHIYEEGACRPGFVCPAACTAYVPDDLHSRIETAARAAYNLGEHLHPWEQAAPATQIALRNAIREALDA